MVNHNQINSWIYLRTFGEYVCFNHVLSKSRTKTIFYYFSKKICFHKHILLGIGSIQVKVHFGRCKWFIQGMLWMIAMIYIEGPLLTKQQHRILPCFLHSSNGSQYESRHHEIQFAQGDQNNSWLQEMCLHKTYCDKFQSVLLLKFETLTLSNQTMTLGEPARYLLGCTNGKWM